jgi:site-specific DNA-adenine methylase
MTLKAPFPWFGGKSRAAHLIWERLGDVPNYVEPFAGSLATLLLRPTPARIETVNDKDCYLANFWRALQADPEGVARHADWPVNEADLRSRHAWLVNEDRPIAERVMADPTFYDVRVAGWWVWGLSQWIGGGWCTTQRAGQRKMPDMNGKGVHAQRVRPWQIKPHLSTPGTGIHAPTFGCWNKRPNLVNQGIGVHREANRGELLIEYFEQLAARLRFVRVCCGDWERVCRPSVTITNGLTGIVLDPPYPASADRHMHAYGVEDGEVAHEVHRWCVENGDNPQLRIALCGYEGTHDELEGLGWTVVEWLAAPGYAGIAKTSKRGKENRKRERIWFSPHCLQVGQQLDLFGGLEVAR